MTLRRAFALVFSLVILPLAAILAQPACAGLTPADKATIALDAVQIAKCQTITRFCKDEAGDAAAEKCWPVYDACMADAGLLE